MGDDGRQEKVGHQNRILACGVELSSIKQQHFDIKNGDYSDIVLPNIQFVIGAGEGNCMVSGEALFFPKDRGVSFIMGRHGDCDITIDREIIAESERGKEREAAKESGSDQDYRDYEEAMENWEKGLRKFGVADLRYVLTLGDLNISRHQLQISRHPNGVTVVSVGSGRLGKNTYYAEPEKPETSMLKSWFSQVSILRNFPQEPEIHEFKEGLFKDSYIINNEDVVLVKGKDRRYCFKFFEEVGKKSLTFKPAMMIKQSFPLDKSIAEIHQELIVNSQQ